MFNCQRFCDTEDHCSAEMSAGGFIFTPAKNNVGIIKPVGHFTVSRSVAFQPPFPPALRFFRLDLPDVEVLGMAGTTAKETQGHGGVLRCC